MNILAIETTGAISSVALMRPGKVIAEFSVNSGLTHSETLLPLIDQMLIATNFYKTDIDAIAASSGPGSFTGLRIGASVAKGLAFALGLKIVPVSTLDALAYNVIMWDGVVVPIMDARRNQVYTALYDCIGGKITRISEYLACNFDDIATMVRNSGKRAVFLGDGVAVHRDKIIEGGFSIAPDAFLLQRASSVGAIALDIADSTMISANQFEPFYIRPSQAEREYQAKL